MYLSLLERDSHRPVGESISTLLCEAPQIADLQFEVGDRATITSVSTIPNYADKYKDTSRSKGVVRMDRDKKTSKQNNKPSMST